MPHSARYAWETRAFARELRALRRWFATVSDAEHEAARIANEARVKLLAAEDQAAQLLADAGAISQFQDLDAEDDTGVYRTVSWVCRRCFASA